MIGQRANLRADAWCGGPARPERGPVHRPSVLDMREPAAALDGFLNTVGPQARTGSARTELLPTAEPAGREVRTPPAVAGTDPAAWTRSTPGTGLRLPGAQSWLDGVTTIGWNKYREEMSMCAIRSVPAAPPPEGRTSTRRSRLARRRGYEGGHRSANDNGSGVSLRGVPGRTVILAAAWRLVLGAGCIGLIIVGSDLAASVQSLP